MRHIFSNFGLDWPPTFLILAKIEKLFLICPIKHQKIFLSDSRRIFAYLIGNFMRITKNQVSTLCDYYFLSYSEKMIHSVSIFAHENYFWSLKSLKHLFFFLKKKQPCIVTDAQCWLNFLFMFLNIPVCLVVQKRGSQCPPLNVFTNPPLDGFTEVGGVSNFQGC